MLEPAGDLNLTGTLESPLGKLFGGTPFRLPVLAPMRS